MLEIATRQNAVKIAIHTLGCKLNQAESETLSRQLSAAGCQMVDPGTQADICIVHTCSVTHVADRKSRQFLRAARRRNPGARVIALGCAVDSGATPLGGSAAVDLSIGNEEKSGLVSLLQTRGWVPTENLNGALLPPSGGRVRAFVKVQEGCNAFCSYCVVPLLRGRETSVLPETVIAEVAERVEEGHREVVITGTEPGRYLSGQTLLPGLIERVLAETRVPRLRVSSLQPAEVTADLLRLWESPRLCRHFHLSLQSGSDSVLQRMGRHYSTAEYREIVALIRDRLPGAAVTTDVIAGFPGEDEREFEESLRFCRELAFARLHVFPFSARAGTRAAELDGQLSPAEITRKMQVWLELARLSRRNYLQHALNSAASVLFEQGKEGLWWGFTGNYIKTYVKDAANLQNTIAGVKLLRLFHDGVEAAISRER